MADRGSLIIVSAPSGAGKSSLIAALIKELGHERVQVSISHTTREPRPGEINGQHYHFVQHNQFKQLIAEEAFYEWAEVFGNYYGTSAAAIEEQLAAGVDVFLDIDWQGAQQIRKMTADVTGIFILPPSKEELETRLRQRGQDSDEVIAGRMAKAQTEISHYTEYDYVIVNDNFEQALANLKAIVIASRLRRAGQEMRHKAILNELLA